jgi:hypothetical protein
VQSSSSSRAVIQAITAGEGRFRLASESTLLISQHYT